MTETLTEIRTTVLAQIDALHDELTQTLQALVRIPSVTPKYPGLDVAPYVGGETRCNERLSQLYEAAGAKIDLWEEEAGRANLVGVIAGNGSGRSLIFNGHVDTVPPGDPATWTGGDPFSGRVEDGRLYGLGSCDMKAGLVAQGIAALALRKAGVQLAGDLILESVVGEETMDHNAGVSATVRRGYTADAAIVTEPTGFTSRPVIAPCSAGVMQLTIDVPGKATHVMVRGSLVWPGGEGEKYGVNAIDKGFLIYQALCQLEREWGFSHNHPLFPPGHFNIGVNVMYGRPPGPPVPFIVPDVCTLDTIVIYPPDVSAEEIREEVERHLNLTFDLDPWLREHRPTMQWKHQWPPYSQPVDHPICQTVAGAHEVALARQAEFAGFPAVDDATYLERGGIPAISFGPGNLMMAHAVDEYVPIVDVVEASKVYAMTALDWCGIAGTEGRANL
jgi:acetylornithine deacetylase/succinyl-diaminopimelate desuccinylase family protein